MQILECRVDMKPQILERPGGSIKVANNSLREGSPSRVPMLNRSPSLPSAFTLIELLALLALLALIVCVAAPGLSKTKPNGRAMQCLSNQRRLIAAWQMYMD